MKKVFFSILLGTILLFVAYKDTIAAPSYDGNSGPVEYINRPIGITQQDYHAMVTGNIKVVVILVDFAGNLGNYTSGPPDGKMDDADISNLDSWFRTGTKNFKNYYSEASYNQLNIDVTYSVKGGTRSNLTNVKSSNCFTMAGSMEWYGQDSQNSLETLVKDALVAAGSNISKSSYNYVLVVHAGYGNETTSNNGDIWSVSVGWSGADQNGFNTGAIVPVKEKDPREPFGVICHEFGHQLGLPDLYDTVPGGGSVVGPYALMDSGTWNDNGKTPPHFCSWIKDYMGWITPQNITADSQNLLLKFYYNNKDNSACKFVVPGKSDEYFLLSYRKKAGNYDIKLPEEGPVFFHIDDSIGTVIDNNINASYQPHPRVDIVGAGTWDTLKIFTAPDSNSYDGVVSGITVFGFELSGSDITFNATVAEFSKSLSFKERPVNFPNPVSNVNTTISFKLTVPEDERSIKIYTPAGEMVKKIEMEEIIAIYVKDNEVTYQADWNLKNEAGENAASGIYVYLVEAGDIKKFGRLTIIRD